MEKYKIFNNEHQMLENLRDIRRHQLINHEYVSEMYSASKHQLDSLFKHELFLDLNIQTNHKREVLYLAAKTITEKYSDCYVEIYKNALILLYLIK